MSASGWDSCCWECADRLGSGGGEWCRFWSRCARQGEAAELLVNSCGHNLPFCENNTPEQIERIRYAALKLSQGRISLLCEAIDLANTDWRDLLVATGFADDVKIHLDWEPESRIG
jgi:hypothetical protein